jgi:hypothetical protein
MESNRDHFYSGGRRFDVTYGNEPNGVRIAETQVYTTEKGVTFHPDHVPFPFSHDDVHGEEAAGSSCQEAFDALVSKLGGEQ